MKSPQEIFDLFKERCKDIVLDPKLKWFCIEVVSYNQRRNYKKSAEYKVMQMMSPEGAPKIKPKIDIYLMAKLGCSPQAKETAQQCAIAMGAKYNVRICPLENELIKREGFYFDL